jgi:hypothetical protein
MIGSAVLAQIPVEIIDEVENSAGLYEWLLFAATAIASVGTLIAIGVALFGPEWRAKRHEPRLTLTAAETSAEWPTMPPYPPVDALHLLVHNERGRDTAHEVEVFVTAVGRGKDYTREDPRSRATIQQNLNFNNPLQGQYGSRVASVPSGFSRRVHFVLLGGSDLIWQAHHQIEGAPRGPWGTAALALYPGRNDNIAYLEPDVEYDIELVVVGSNFDAVAYSGTVRYEDRVRPDITVAKFTWIAVPRRP